MLSNLCRLRQRKTRRISSWDASGRNQDYWVVPPHSRAVLADITGPAQMTHLWMTQVDGYRECLLKITYDGAPYPSLLAPLGDFFCLGHGMVNTFESAPFSASTAFPYQFDKPSALNCYLPMPFARRAVVELINESDSPHLQYFYLDYETLESFTEDVGYLHAEFRRVNPFQGWGSEIPPNTPAADAANLGRQAWENNYLILETQGRGHYIGCNLSVTNFTGNWWGEGDDMIWIDGYKWAPDLHGTGSEDYFGHGGGMQEMAALRNGSAIFEGRTIPTPEFRLWRGDSGYQTSYVFHLENPARFQQEIKVTIEHGHANHLANEMSSVAYWYADRPTPAAAPPSLQQRLPIRRERAGEWLHDPERLCPGRQVNLTEEMHRLKAQAGGS